MGVHVSLTIAPDQIDPAAWALVFEETLHLLRSHPSNLMGFDHTEIQGHPLQIYTHDIERDRGADRHRWSVVGDRRSLSTAEVHTLYRRLDRYRPPDFKRSQDDILWRFADDAQDLVAVLSNKTQGQPYHFPVLAAAAVIEHRFPGYAMAGGDIDRGQAERACQWARSVLKEDIAPPVRTDPVRLLQRLRPRYEGPALVHAFHQTFLGAPYEADELLLKLLAASIAEPAWLTDFATYRELTTLGALRLLIAWLNAAGDSSEGIAHGLMRLCQLCCSAPEGPMHDPKTFIDALAHTWLLIPKSKTSFLDVFEKPEGECESVASMFGGMLLDMEAPGRHLRHRLHPGDLEGALAAVFSDRAAALTAHMRQESEKIEAQLEDRSKDVSRLSTKVHQARSGDLEALATLSSPKELSKAQESQLDDLAYLTRTMDRQVLAKASQNTSQNPDLMQHLVAGVCSQRSLVFTESAWAWILKEEDLGALKVLAAAALSTSTSKDFAHLRRAVFENRPLCMHVAKARSDEKRMQAIEAQLRAQKAQDN